MTDFNDVQPHLIDEFRANDGKVTGMFAGAPLRAAHDDRRQVGQAAHDAGRVHERRRQRRGDRVEGRRADAAPTGTTTSSRTPT